MYGLEMCFRYFVDTKLRFIPLKSSLVYLYCFSILWLGILGPPKQILPMFNKKAM